jgi:hypothetical protein
MLASVRDPYAMEVAEDSSMRRSLAVAMVVVMAGISLAGCFLRRPLVQRAALAMVDGRPTAVVAACGRSSVDVAVHQDNGDYAGNLYEWSVTVTPPSPAKDIEVELFGAERPGWDLTTEQERIVGSGQSSFKVIPLTSFDEGHHYKLTAGDYGPEGSSAPAVAFTTDDLPTIGDGKVLTAVDNKHTKIVSRESFVRDLCG